MTYTTKIIESSDELTARERILMKDTSNAIALDEATADSPLVIEPIKYAIVQTICEGEKPEDYKEYNKYIIIDSSGNKYITGSETFFTNYLDILHEMNGEKFSIEIYQKESKNYKGKHFITCSIV